MSSCNKNTWERKNIGFSFLYGRLHFPSLVSFVPCSCADLSEILEQVLYKFSCEEKMKQAQLKETMQFNFAQASYMCTNVFPFSNSVSCKEAFHDLQSNFLASSLIRRSQAISRKKMDTLSLLIPMAPKKKRCKGKGLLQVPIQDLQKFCDGCFNI